MGGLEAVRLVACSHLTERGRGSRIAGCPKRADLSLFDNWIER